MFETNQMPVEIGGMRERSVHIVKFQNINLSIFDIKAICSLPCLFMELQWLRRERQRGRGAITRLSLWRHLLVVVSRHRLVCVNRTTELSGWAWPLTFPPAPASNKEDDNDDEDTKEGIYCWSTITINLWLFGFMKLVTQDNFQCQSHTHTVSYICRFSHTKPLLYIPFNVQSQSHIKLIK